MAKWKKKENSPTIAEAERYELLSPMLDSLRSDVEGLSKKKPDEPMNELKVKMTNQILNEVLEFLKDDPSVKFLQLLDTETLPSNSDAYIILGQFRAAMNQFKSKNHGYVASQNENVWHCKDGFL